MRFSRLYIELVRFYRLHKRTPMLILYSVLILILVVFAATPIYREQWPFFVPLLAVLVGLYCNQVSTSAARANWREGLWRGIHLELLYSLNYLSRDLPIELTPKLNRSAWDTACSSGVINLTSDLSKELRQIYSIIDTFNFLVDDYRSIIGTSTKSEAKSDQIARELVINILNIRRLLVPELKKVVVQDLEKYSGIIGDEFSELQSKLQEHMVEQSPSPHAFYGLVKINGRPAEVGSRVEARGKGVLRGMAGNPIITTEVGKYGSKQPLATKLIVQGRIPEETDIEFYVNGLYAGKRRWQSGIITKLDLAVTKRSVKTGQTQEEKGV